MTDLHEIAARYGVPTPEELAAEYGKRGLGWTDGTFYTGARDTGDGRERCCAVGMLVLIETSDPAVLPDLAQGAAWDYLRRLPRGFINGIIHGNDGGYRPRSSWDSREYVEGWEYGTAVRLAEVTHD